MCQLCRGRNAYLIHVDVVQSINCNNCSKTFSLQQKLRHPDPIFCTTKLQIFNQSGKKLTDWGKIPKLGIFTLLLCFSFCSK